jgi:outer membrane protein
MPRLNPLHSLRTPPQRGRASPLALALKLPLVLALGLTLTAQAPAQTQSLLELYDAARAYDAPYQSARSQADAVVFKAEQSRALRRPLVNATATLSEGRTDTPYTTTTSTRSSVQSLGVTAQQSLFNRGNDKTIAQAERAIEVANSQLQAAEQDLIVRLVQAYFDVLAAGDALDTVRASKKAIAETLASAKRNFEVGTATITDTREAQARFDLGTAQELAAENDLNVKRLALASVAGRPGASPKPLAVPVVLPPIVPAAIEDWVTQADSASPALTQLRLAREVARLETEKARTGHLPTVGLSASFAESNTRLAGETSIGGKSGSFGPTSGRGPQSSVALLVNLPLFSGYSVQNRIKETLSLEDRAQSDLEAARRNTAQATRSAFFTVQSLRGQVLALEAAESSSQLALAATQLGYKVGVRVNLDVLNAQSQLFQAQRDLAKARYDVIFNGLRLRLASGLLQPQDVNAVDALLAR